VIVHDGPIKRSCFHIHDRGVTPGQRIKILTRAKNIGHERIPSVLNFKPCIWDFTPTFTTTADNGIPGFPGSTTTEISDGGCDATYGLDQEGLSLFCLTKEDPKIKIGVLELIESLDLCLRN
jgi:hypothetical protein